MKIYLDNIPIGDVPGPSRQPGEFFLRLVGFRVSSAGKSEPSWVDVEPIYMPKVRIHKQAGQVLVEINGDRPLFYITIQSRQPYLSVFRFDWDSLDSDLPENA